MYQVTASIVIYKPDIQELLATIRSFLSTKLSVLLIIIDNSPNKEAEKAIPKNDKIEYHYMGENVGFGKGHNYAIQRIKGLTPYHLVLNPDVEFTNGVIETLIDYLGNHTKAGVVAPTVFEPNEEGEKADSCRELPTPFTLINRKLRRSSAKDLYLKQISVKPFSSPWISGCFMLFRVQALEEVGLFDDRYFMYFEDVDLSRRIHKKGWEVVCVPTVSINHIAHRESSHSTKLLKIHLMSAIKYFNKWGWFFDKERSTINKECARKFILSSDYN